MLGCSMILSSNQLSSLPFEVSQLYCLRHIDLSRNRFKVFPAAVRALFWLAASLTCLHLS
mgnify:CR=1 FL=1